MSKMEWIRPRGVVQAFQANEYVGACWVFDCSETSGYYGYTGFYVDRANPQVQDSGEYEYIKVENHSGQTVIKSKEAPQLLYSFPTYSDRTYSYRESCNRYVYVYNPDDRIYIWKDSSGMNHISSSDWYNDKSKFS